MIIKIKDNDIKFGYGLYFLGKAQKEFKKDLGELLNSMVENPIADIIDLMFYSARCEAELDEITLPITKRDFLELLELEKDFNNTDGYIAKWSNSLIESIKGNFLPPPEEDFKPEKEVKKK